MSERELFIQNYIKYVNNQADFTILNETENTFYDDAVDDAWVMWQLSANRQGYKLVPVEATNEQWVAAIDAYTIAMNGQDILSASAFYDIYEAMIGAVE